MHSRIRTQEQSHDHDDDEDTVMILLDVMSIYPSLKPSDAVDHMMEVKEELRMMGCPCVASTEAMILLGAVNIDPQVPDECCFTGVEKGDPKKHVRVATRIL